MVTVIVTGANGYIGEWIVVHLLEKGYKVVGTVRSAEKGETLKKQLNTKDFQYEVVAEMGSTNAFDEALKNHPEVTVFIHNASPVSVTSTDPLNEVILPAVNGTKNVLSAIKSYGPQITKVVYTSSFAAAISPAFMGDNSLVTDEDSWCPLSWEESASNPVFAYFGSKKYAEEAVWDFVKNEKPNFTVNSILPTGVIGPEAFPLEGRKTLKSTADRLREVIEAGTDLNRVPELCLPYIDVRDVAKAHLHAFESDVTNFRYVLSETLYTNYDVLDVLNKNVPELKGKIAVAPPGAGDKAKTVQGTIDNSRTKKVLGFEPISFEQATIDGAYQYLADK